MNRSLIINKSEQLVTYSAELELFFSLYLKNFPDADEREDPKIISDRILFREKDSILPETIILLSFWDEVVSGGAVLEYYAQSNCFLLTYIVVDQEFRGKNIAKSLVNSGIRKVLDSKGQPVEALFFESNIPWETDSQNDSFDGWDRYQVFSRLGAKWLDMDYCQPSLGKGKKSVDHLHLFIFPHLTGLKNRISRQLINDFLVEFYRSLGIDQPESNSDFIRISHSLGQLKEFLPLKEVPVPERPMFQFGEVSVAYHLDEEAQNPGFLEVNAEFPACHVIGSFESDLLKFRYQDAPPFQSVCHFGDYALKCKVNFPVMTTYLSEGRMESMRNLSGSLTMDLKINCSTFRFGRKIWTMVLTPETDATISEEQVIKLIALFNRSTELNNIARETTFEAEGILFNSLESLATFITKGKNLKLSRSGIIQVDFSAVSGGSVNDKFWKELIGAISGTIESATDAFSKLEARYHEDETFERALNLICGFSLGIFDYRRMVFEEVIETLRPLTNSSTSQIWLNKGILSAMNYQDESFLRCRHNIGISPYLLISSMLLVSNEIEASHAGKIVAGALENREAALKDLIAQRKLIEQKLHEEILINVFHYPGEQKIFNEGMKQRGIDDQITALENKLGRLNQLIKDKDTHRKASFEKKGVIMLAVISIMSLETVIGDFTLFLKNTLKISWLQGDEPKWIIFMLVAVIVFLLILYFTLMSIVDATQKIEKKRGTRNFENFANTFWKSFLRRTRKLLFWRD